MELLGQTMCLWINSSETAKFFHQSVYTILHFHQCQLLHILTNDGSLFLILAITVDV